MEQKAIDNMSSQELWERARLSLAGGVSYDERFLPPYPIYTNRVSGGRNWDVERREYIDYEMGSAATVLGLGTANATNGLLERKGAVTDFHFDSPAVVMDADGTPVVPQQWQVLLHASGALICTQPARERDSADKQGDGVGS